MNHNQTVVSNEIDRLRQLAALHRDAAKTGVGFEYGVHTYRGDAAFHLKCSRNLDKVADNLARQL
jgi:hypothetical protein